MTFNDIFLGSLQHLKRLVDERQAKLVSAKAEYRTALRNLESISEEIHAQRRSLAMGTREQGVGAEGDGADDDDIANFKMESDGLSSECPGSRLLVRSAPSAPFGVFFCFCSSIRLRV